jgi:hypothetical protein
MAKSITYNGKTKSIAEWASHLGYKHKSFMEVANSKYSGNYIEFIDYVLNNSKLQPNGRRVQLIELDGIKRTRSEWAEVFNLTPAIFAHKAHKIHHNDFVSLIRYLFDQPIHIKQKGEHKKLSVRQEAPQPIKAAAIKSRFAIQVRINQLIEITPPCTSLMEAASRARDMAGHWLKEGLVTKEQHDKWRVELKEALNEIKSHHALVVAQRKEK